jgi:urea-proton symporter
MATTLPLFSQTTGLILLIAYGGFAFGITYWFSRGYNDTKTSFLVARRELNTFEGSLSIAAAWLWAPALFLSSQQAYVNGFVGLFWFCIGNIVTLVVFAFFAGRLRRWAPEGFTFSGYVRERFSDRVQSLYVSEMSVLAGCAFAINLLAGSRMLETLTGLPYRGVSFAMAAIALSYSFQRGLKATVITEIMKIVIVWAGVFALVPAAIYAAGGWGTVLKGLGGVRGDGRELIGTIQSWHVFASFGITAFLGHMGGPWGDNSFYQRAFAIRKNSVVRSFLLAALVFGVIPVAMGTLGFVAAGAGLSIPSEQLGTTNVITIATFLPRWASTVFVILVLAGLVSVLDSQFSSAANMTGHDIYNRYKTRVDDAQVIFWARSGMLILAAVGLGVCMIPRITILHLFLFFANLRAAVWFPSMLAMLWPRFVSEPSMFWSILISVAVGMPVFIYGQLNGLTSWSLAGTLISIAGSLILVVAISYFGRTAKQPTPPAQLQEEVWVSEMT